MKKNFIAGELVRGKGAPLLTIEGALISIADILWVVEPNAYHPKMPYRGEVIGIDLTRRTVRLRNKHGAEALHCAQERGHEFLWLFTGKKLAVQNSIKLFKKNVEVAEQRADKAMDELTKAKQQLAKAEAWKDGGTELEECPA